MAMVISKKSKLAMCSVCLLVILGVSLAVLSTVGVFENKHGQNSATAEKYSQGKSQPQVIDKVSIINNTKQ